MSIVQEEVPGYGSLTLNLANTGLGEFEDTLTSGFTSGLTSCVDSGIPSPTEEVTKLSPMSTMNFGGNPYGMSAQIEALLARYKAQHSFTTALVKPDLSAEEENLKRKAFESESGNEGHRDRRSKVDDMSEDELRRRHEVRLLRNRISARKSRERKKQMVDVMEDEVNKLRRATQELEHLVSQLVNENERLRRLETSNNAILSPATALNCAIGG